MHSGRGRLASRVGRSKSTNRRQSPQGTDAALLSRRGLVAGVCAAVVCGALPSSGRRAGVLKNLMTFAPSTCFSIEEKSSRSMLCLLNHDRDVDQGQRFMLERLISPVKHSVVEGSVASLAMMVHWCVLKELYKCLSLQVKNMFGVWCNVQAL